MHEECFRRAIRFCGGQQGNSWLCWANTTGWQRESRLYIISVFRERYRDYERSQAVKLGRENNALDCSLTHQDRKEAPHPPPPTHPKVPPHHAARPAAISLLNTSSLIRAPAVYLMGGLTGRTDQEFRAATFWKEAAGFFSFFYPSKRNCISTK